MIFKKQLLSKIPILFLAILTVSCTQAPDVKWDFSKNEITGAGKTPVSDKLNVDVYLDVTTSMKGFVSPATTNYSRLLDDIEATCNNVWKSTDMKYYKYGRSVQPISREDFTSGKTSPVMYADPVLSTQTNFAEAVKKTDPKRVSILITDLFYKNSDVNLVVSAIKDYCFKKKVEAGLISLNSPFTGIVGDVVPYVNVKNGTRPLYVLVFGDKQNIDLFFKTMKNKPYIASTQFLLITNHPTESYEVSLVKDKKNRTVNKQSLPSAWKKADYGTVFSFTMKTKATEALFNLDLKLNTNPNIPIFKERNLKLQVFEKTAGQKDSISANDKVSIENMKLTGNRLTGNIMLKNGEGAGKYGYLVYLTLDNTVPQQMPKWVLDKNTNTYAQGVNEDKTLNLDKLLTDVSSNHTTAVQPKLAKFYINIIKK